MKVYGPRAQATQFSYLIRYAFRYPYACPRLRVGSIRAKGLLPQGTLVEACMLYLAKILCRRTGTRIRSWQEFFVCGIHLFLSPFPNGTLLLCNSAPMTNVAYHEFRVSCVSALGNLMGVNMTHEHVNIPPNIPSRQTSPVNDGKQPAGFSQSRKLD